MNKEEQKFGQIVAALEQKRIQLALSIMKTWVLEIHNGFFFDRLDTLTTNYQYLLQYFIQGIDDPQRNAIYSTLLTNCYEFASDLYEAVREQQSQHNEFKRMREHKWKEFIDCRRIEKVFACYSEGLAARCDYEEALNDFFDELWLQSHYTAEMVQLYNQVIVGEQFGKNEKCLAVSALTLNLWRYFSVEKFNLLITSCLQTTGDVQQRALVGLVFLLTKYDQFLPHFPLIIKQLTLFADRPELLSLIEKIVTQIIRTSETEKVTQEMQNNIIPKLIKISPQMRSRLKADMLANADDEPNPEWENWLDNLHIDKDLQKMSEMQLEGSDIYLSTFLHLKRPEFFHTYSHWFLPFDKQWSDVAHLFDKQKTFITAFTNNAIFCNSDKYSFCFYISGLPENEQNIMKNTMQAQTAQMQENMNKFEQNENNQTLVSNQYIHDLYRFFKLKADAGQENMFAYSLRMHHTKWFQQLFSAPQTQLHIANFYFIKQAYREAIELFSALETIFPTAELFQKKGYSLQQLGELAQATQAYECADLIAPENIWTLKHLATCQRLQGNNDKALDFYRQIEKLAPTDKRNLLNLGLCLLDMQQGAEAMQLYYKLDIDFPDDVQVERAIAWCSFVMEKYEQAQRYWERVLAKKTTADDYLNAAHNAWCLNQHSAAVQHYQKSAECCKTRDEFWTKFKADVPYLKQRGISDVDLALMIDAI